MIPSFPFVLLAKSFTRYLVPFLADVRNYCESDKKQNSCSRTEPLYNKKIVCLTHSVELFSLQNSRLSVS